MATPAVGVVGPGGVLAVTGPRQQLFRWASVTKILTALACLVAVEEGTLDLAEPAGPAGSTVRHLLAHASGLPFDGGEAVSAPEKRRIYSNAGFEALAAVLARRSGMDFTSYLAEGVLGPLGLRDTRLAGSPASGAVGPLQDLLILGRELLRPTLVAAGTITRATTVVFPGLSGVLPGFGFQSANDWGLGLELRDSKHPHWTGGRNSPETFGHFGQSGSFLWVDPHASLACACLTDTDFGPWARRCWPVLADEVISYFGPESTSRT